MDIIDLIKEETININLKSVTKVGVIEELTNMLAENGLISDKKKFIKAILEREKKSSTGVGNGIAIPHAKTNIVIKPAIVIGISKKGIDFGSLDSLPVHLFCMIAINENNNLHLEILSSLAKRLIDTKFIKQIYLAQSNTEIVNLFRGE